MLAFRSDIVEVGGVILAVQEGEFLRPRVSLARSGTTYRLGARFVSGHGGTRFASAFAGGTSG